MKKGDKVICVRDYIAAEPRRKLYSVGEVSEISSIGSNSLVWINGLLMRVDNYNITDLVGDTYFVLLNESRKQKLKNLEIVSKYSKYESNLYNE